MALGIHALEDKSWTFKQGVTIEGALTVEGNFTFGDAATDNLIVAGDLRVNDDRFLHFGTGEDVSFEYDENGTDDLRISTAAALGVGIVGVMGTGTASGAGGGVSFTGGAGGASSGAGGAMALIGGAGSAGNAAGGACSSTGGAGQGSAAGGAVSSTGGAGGATGVGGASSVVGGAGGSTSGAGGAVSATSGASSAATGASTASASGAITVAAGTPGGADTGTGGAGGTISVTGVVGGATTGSGGTGGAGSSVNITAGAGGADGEGSAGTGGAGGSVVITPGAGGAGNTAGAAGNCQVAGDFTYTGHKDSQILLFNEMRAVSDWAVAADGSMTLAKNLSTKKLVISLSALKVGDEITAWRLQGALGATGGQATVVDSSLRRVAPGAGAVSDTEIAAAAQVSVTADTSLDWEKTLAAHTVLADNNYYVLVTGTTANDAACDIALTGLELDVNRK